MAYYYSAERNVQMVLFLLKVYKIKKVIVSPGATNVAIVASMQQDPYFDMYSCVDERSAGYMAVGMAEESGEPVVLSCTGATSARNYMPALTEAYYRKIPIIAITSTQDKSHVGHLIAQVTDRSQQPKDLVIESVYIQNIRSLKDEWDCTIKLNRILQAFRPIPGPIHIDLATGMGGGYGVLKLPEAKIIRKYLSDDTLPEINVDGHIAIFIGSHVRFTDSETKVIDRFCSIYKAVVFCDHTSSYRGKYRVMYALLGAQDKKKYEVANVGLLIYIGEVSGDYDTLRKIIPERVWRVNPDGQFRDTFMGKLDTVFAMSEMCFFEKYIGEKGDSYLKGNEYFNECNFLYSSLISKIVKLPFSNIYVANKLSKVIPENSVLYLGILNSLRSWNYFEVPHSVHTVCNVGGFGIDGIASSLVGASMCYPEVLHFGVLGDLSFFYDINSIGNRQIGSNLRILIINNGHGQEFEMYNHAAAFLGEDVNKYVAAEGHYGFKSRNLIKHYSEDLGFYYISASSCDEFDRCCSMFVSTDYKEKPMVFEVFTDKKEESSALKIIRNLEKQNANQFKKELRDIYRKILKK